jgi:hypothetical protein
MPTIAERTVDADTLALRARGALEHVCSGAGLEPAACYYSPSFVDHVGDLEFHGLAGVERSVGLYKAVLSEIQITVQEQVVQGERVTSRFLVEGLCLGRRVRFGGITISRFEQAHIVEDWSVTDTLGMLRQLGLWRALLVGLRSAWYLRGSARQQAPGSPST